MSAAPKGFTIIPLKFSAESKTYHELFVKSHTVRNQSDDRPPDRTLLVCNVPPYATQDSIKRVFSCTGPVVQVTFQREAGAKEAEPSGPIAGYKVAYIVYEKSSSLEKALQLTELEPLSTDEHPIITGMQKWAREYNEQIYDRDELEKQVNEYMTQYDAEVEKRKQKEKQDDSGGWTVVKKKGRTPGLARKESVKNKLLEKAEKGAKRKYLTNFYKFQNRESKMNHLADMRKKYEEDKKKVQTMKLARTFKPF